mmetsp:Transcript_16503/g.27909  ORF Transcript_16503/g.27909 Transcript_16503/m.27909 type:complete len:528 (-) Transcript_16503:159-1742(-)
MAEEDQQERPSDTKNDALTKKVTFVKGTYIHDDDHIALSITRHSYIHDKGYTQYLIKFLCRGVEWTLHKRYRDFHDLHSDLSKENAKYGIELPKLPEKRWFHRQRWFNSGEEKYCWERRLKLQAYLRNLVKIRVLRDESLSFWTFICMPKRAMADYNAHALMEQRIMSLKLGEQRSAIATSSNSIISRLYDDEDEIEEEEDEDDRDVDCYDDEDSALPPAQYRDRGEDRVIRNSFVIHGRCSVEEFVQQDTAIDEDPEEVSVEENNDDVGGRQFTNAGNEFNDSGVRNGPSDTTKIGISGSNGADGKFMENRTILRNTNVKLNRIFDDDGNVVDSQSTADSALNSCIIDPVEAVSSQNSADLSLIASSNAMLNSRITSKDGFQTADKSINSVLQQLSILPGEEEQEGGPLHDDTTRGNLPSSNALLVVGDPACTIGSNSGSSSSSSSYNNNGSAAIDTKGLHGQEVFDESRHFRGSRDLSTASTSPSGSGDTKSYVLGMLSSDADALPAIPASAKPVTASASSVNLR